MQHKTLWLVLPLCLAVANCKKKGGSDSSRSSGPPPAEETVAEDTTTVAGTIQVSDEAAEEEATTSAVAEESVAVANARALATDEMSPSVNLRPAAALNITALLSNAFTEAKEDVLTYDPAQEPLKTLNEVVCVASRSGFYHFPNVGAYTANVTLEDCFRAEGGDQGASGAAPKPTAVTVKTAQGDNGSVSVDMWFTQKIDPSMGSMLGIPPSGGPPEDIAITYYAQATIHEANSDSNPFGVFKIRWQSFLAIDGTAQSNARSEGYVETYRKSEQEVALEYHEVRNSYFSVQCPSNGSLSDDLRDAYVSQAIATMEIVDGKPVAGKARTSENFASEVITNSGCPEQPSGFQSDESGSYSLVFEKDLISGSEHPGRVLTKWIPGSGFTNYATQAQGGFDPTAPRCEQIGGEFTNVWDYALFNTQDQPIKHKTFFQIHKATGGDKYGDGFVDSYGASMYGTVSNGESVYIIAGDGEKKFFNIELFNGKLMNNEYQSVVTTQGDTVFTCSSFCPAGDVTQTMVNSPYESSHFLSSATYVWVENDKKLYRDANDNGTDDGDFTEVKMAAGVMGFLEISFQDGSANNFRYELNSYNPVIGLKSGSSYFQVPGSIVFDSSQTWDNDRDSYKGSENSSAQGETLKALADNQDWNYSHGYLCCIGYEEKDGFVDGFGNKLYGMKVVPKKGFTLTISGDPDGTGPLEDGQTVKLAPLFSEKLPRTKSDCPSSILAKAEDLPGVLSLPEALASTERQVKTEIGTKPSDAPVLVLDGDKL